MPKGIVAKISAETEREIVRLHQEGDSARSLAKRFGIGHGTLRRILDRHGFDTRDPTTAGLLQRTMEELPPWDRKKSGMSLANYVAKSMGYSSSKGRSDNRDFLTAYESERRKRNTERCRETDNRRKQFLNRIPAWVDKRQIEAFHQMASDLGLHVDHDVPLQGKNICGLNVPSNLRLVAAPVNWSKQNKFVCGPDYLIGHPDLYRKVV